jgi:hypothetical protein
MDADGVGKGQWLLFLKQIHDGFNRVGTFALLADSLQITVNALVVRSAKAITPFREDYEKTCSGSAPPGCSPPPARLWFPR